jgi:hypothetical protein
VPFVQGRLRETPLRVTIASRCAHCDRPIDVEIDSDLGFGLRESAAKPVICIPIVDFAKLRAPNIIDDF